MQSSSPATPLRILVMLACLVAIPLAAVFGTSLPDAARQWWDSGWGKTKAVAQNLLPEAPPFRPGQQTGDLPGPPNWNSQLAQNGAAGPGMNTQAGQEPRPLDIVAAQKPIPWQLGGGDRFSQRPRDAVSPIPVVAETGPGNTMAAFVDQTSQSRDWERSSKQAAPPGPASMAAPFNNGSHMDDLGRAAANSGPAMTQGSRFDPRGVSNSPLSQSSTDQFANIQQQLRDWGATYYRLETWGNAGQMYRFYCKMAIARSPSHTQYFEATASEPLQAMGKVLHDVDAWRTRR